MGKKDRERGCLDATLAICPTHRGETRRLLKRLDGAVELLESERPDFTFIIPHVHRSGGNTVVGLEHFAIDQCVERRRKSKHGDENAVNSLSAKRRAGLESIRKEYGPRIAVGEEIPMEAIDKFLNECSNAMADALTCSYPELMASFRTVFNKHLKRADAYRRNLHEVAEDVGAIELGFLIEMHADDNRFALVRGGRGRECERGDILVFEDMLGVMESAAGKVDFIILVSYGSLDVEPSKVLAFRCNNIRKSINKQGFPICRYIGMDAYAEAFKMERPSMSANWDTSEDGAEIGAQFEREPKGAPDEDGVSRKECAHHALSDALSAIRDGDPCVMGRGLYRCLREFGFI